MIVSREPVPPVEIKIAAVIPCFRVRDQVISVINKLGPEITHVYCIDDHCTEQSGKFIAENVQDKRVMVLYHEVNKGVGGAILTGYRQALADGCDIFVKIDGDGQMDPGLVPDFIWPIVSGYADYTKGNRFYNIEHARRMPFIRLVGNGVLSFMTKFSSGYWNIFDPTNGYTAIHRSTAFEIVSRKIDSRYFFESDMLLNLYLLRAVVQDIPMASVYDNEPSSLRVSRVIFPFLMKNLRNAGRRVAVQYFIREFSLATLEGVLGAFLLIFGTVFGATSWIQSTATGEAATAGQVMLAALPILMGLQLILSAINYDMRTVPTIPRLRQPKLLCRKEVERITQALHP